MKFLTFRVFRAFVVNGMNGLIKICTTVGDAPYVEGVL